ncbi:MAG: hypothetical protein V1835_03760 [Candidatus Micrarchaeota archaeon]
MDRSGYCIVRDDAVYFEDFLLDYYLEAANIVRLHPISIIREPRPPSKEIINFGGLDDPKVRNTLKKLEKFLVKQESNDEIEDKHRIGVYFNRDNNGNFIPIPQKWLYYRLEGELKEYLKVSKMFMHSYSDEEFPLWGLEDPAFFKDKELLAEIISHETAIYVHLTNEEKTQFDSRKVPLTPI